MSTAATDITVVITTRDRSADLRRAIASCLRQTVPTDVLVMDDGSTDGSADMVRKDFPFVRVERSETSLGLVTQRNRALPHIHTPLFLSLDDDAYFPSTTTLEQTLKDFDHPRIAVVDIPMLNFLPELNEPRPTVAMDVRESPLRMILNEFHGGVNAMRRDVFQAVGGFHDEVVRQGEERDLSIRLLDWGYVVRAGRGEPIHHHPSPARDFSPIYFYGRRSDVLFNWWNVPMPHLPVLLAGMSLRAVVTGWRRGYLGASVKGLMSGYAACLRSRTPRRPVSRQTHRLSRLLRERGPLPLDEIESMLPPLAPC